MKSQVLGPSSYRDFILFRRKINHRKEQLVTSILRNRTFIILVGIMNIILFLFTIGYLFIFLYDTRNVLVDYKVGFLTSIIIDFALLFNFSFTHSYFLKSEVKTKICSIIPWQIYYVFYSLQSCVGLILIYLFWRPFGGVIYEFGPSNSFVWGLLISLFLASWLLMGLTMRDLGNFKQSGTDQWIDYLKNRPQKNEIPYSGTFKYVRHPVYLAFVGMMSFNPVMTLDHFCLTIFLLGYIIWGTINKEKRLIKNKKYEKYCYQVAPYPFFPKRPLSQISMMGGFMKVIIFLISLVFVPRMAYAEDFKGTYKFESFEKAQEAKSMLRFQVESTKIGLFSSDVPGFIKAFNYNGSYDAKKKMLKNLVVEFKVMDMDTDNDSRDEKLHNEVINHKEFPLIKVTLPNLDSKSPSETKYTNGIINIRGKNQNITIKVTNSNVTENEITVEGSTTLSLKELMKIGVQDPSIAVAKLSDEIQVNFKISHQRK